MNTNTSPADTFEQRTVFDIAGMDCLDCARSVTVAVERLPGVTGATVNFGAGTLTIESEANARVDLSPRVIHAVHVAGYRATPRTAGGSAHRRDSILRDPRAVSSLVAGCLWVMGALLSRADTNFPASELLYVTALLIAGWTYARAAWQAIRSRRIDMNVLMTVAVVGAVLLGEWSEAALAAVLFAIGNLAQSLTLDRTRQAVSALKRLTPAEALLVRGGAESRVAAEDLRTGNVIRVRPGERFPVDGRILEGVSTIDESVVTGEAMPADKSTGAEVFGGTLNGQGALLIEVTRSVSDSTVAQIVNLVEEARGSRGRSEQTIDRFAAIYTPVVVAAAGIVAAGGWWATGEARVWITRALVLLVVACPCALIISTPVAIVSAIGTAARRGFLVKGGAPLEQIARLRAIAFDKTGTLTVGQPVVTDILPVPCVSESELIVAAASVERLSEHPLALAIVAEAANRGLAVEPAIEFAAISGRGASARVGKSVVLISSPSWYEGNSREPFPAEHAKAIDDLASQGKTPLIVSKSDVPGSRSFELLGIIAVADRLRAEAPVVVTALRELGISSVQMLTGDNPITASSIAKEAGITQVHAGLLPAEKLHVLGDMRGSFGPVGMVGDGINDGPALATADLGFSMGLTGSDVAIETADVAILRNDLFAIPGAIQLSAKTVAIIKQNIGISLAVKAAAIVLALFGLATLWMAVAVDMGTSLLVTANALRLTRWKLDIPGRVHRNRDRQPGTGEAAGEATGVASVPGTGITTGSLKSK